ncbi:hypothetical protein [Pseudoruegeria sp. HB172150]|nr:hypothetical protein [Pseudoruegeria sp. HB172150]
MKRPVAVLVRSGEEMRAFSPDGAALSRTDIEALCPGAWARFETAAKR